MTCKDVNDLLDRLMDGELSEDERAELEAHGRQCPDCAEQINATLQMKALFEDTLPEVDVPLAAQAKWRGAIREAAKQDRKRRLTRWIGSAAAAVVVLAGVGLALRGGMAPKQNSVERMAVVQEAAEAYESAEEESAVEYDAAPEANVAPVADTSMKTEAASEANVAPVAEAASEAEIAPVIETDGATAGEADAPVGSYGAPKAMMADEAPAAEAAGAAEEEAVEIEEAALGDAPMCAALAQQSPACEYAIQARSVEIACEVIGDLAGEFEGKADVQTVEGGSANVYVELDAGYAAEFLAAVAKLDDSQSPADPPEISGEGTVLVLLVVAPAEGE